MSISNKNEKKVIKEDKKRKFNIKTIIFIFIILILLGLYIFDKFTANNIDKIFSKYINNKLIKNNPDSLIITVYVNKNQIANIPIINYDKITIDWGDGSVEKYTTYRLNESDIKLKKEKLIEKEKEKKKNNKTNIKDKKEENITLNIYDNIITPIHKYDKKGKYNIVITGDTNRGIFGYTNYTTTDTFGIKMFKKEFSNKIPVYNKKNINDENKKELIDKYISLQKEKFEKDNEIQIYNIISFKNLNFKGLGILTEYFLGEINNFWIKEFKNIEIFIETFSFSDITYIPEDIFKLSPNLRILSATFLSCNKLENIPDNLIDNLALIENVRYCFSNCKNLEGNAPEWWKTMNKIKNTKDKDNLPYLLCFNECSKLENFAKIPFFWGGIIQNNVKEKSK